MEKKSKNQPAAKTQSKNPGPEQPKTKTAVAEQPKTKNPGTEQRKSQNPGQVPQTKKTGGDLPKTPAGIDKVGQQKSALVDVNIDRDIRVTEMLFTQSEHASAIRAMQSQMDTMALGMAACGSILKGAKEKVDQQREFGESALEGSRTLADAIKQLRTGHMSLQRLGTDVPHRMLETHLKTLERLVNVGEEFTEAFTSLAADVNNATEALAQWLQGDQEGDVEMESGSESGPQSESEGDEGEEGEEGEESESDEDSDEEGDADGADDD